MSHRRSHKAAKAPKTAMGVLSRTLKGRLQLSYSAARIRKTKTRVAGTDLAHPTSGAGGEGALQDYSEAIRLNPDYADAFYNRGAARRANGDLEGALHDYNEAIRLKSDDAEAFFKRGAARHDKGDLEGAVQDYSE